MRAGQRVKGDAVYCSASTAVSQTGASLARLSHFSSGGVSSHGGHAQTGVGATWGPALALHSVGLVGA